MVATGRVIEIAAEAGIETGIEAEAQGKTRCGLTVGRGTEAEAWRKIGTGSGTGKMPGTRIGRSVSSFLLHLSGLVTLIADCQLAQE